MKTTTSSQAKRTMIGASTIALLAFASIAGAMQETEVLEEFVTEVEADLAGLYDQACYVEALAIAEFIVDTGQLRRIWNEVDRLERQALAPLYTALDDTKDKRNKAAGTRVRKQMQKIKQAAQLVRNRILEIRAAQDAPFAVMVPEISSMPTAFDPAGHSSYFSAGQALSPGGPADRVKVGTITITVKPGV